MAVVRLTKLCAVAMMLVLVPLTSSVQATMPHAAPPIPVPKPVDAATAERMQGIEPVSQAGQGHELLCLAQAIYFEARSEPVRGQRAVGQVVLNRVASPHYPDTICDVVHENAHLPNRCQFSFACDGEPDTITEQARWREIVWLARGLLACKTDCNDEPAAKEPLWTSTHYHADYVSPHWAKALWPTGHVGHHFFYHERMA
jgi:spore germination cell wall hydrolase CwlJ-like protein